MEVIADPVSGLPGVLKNNNNTDHVNGGMTYDDAQCIW